MLTFRHGDKSVTLETGNCWAVQAPAVTYRDTSKEELEQIVEAIENGAPWHDVISLYYAQRNPWLHQIVTSPTRDLFLRQFPPQKGTKILDVGSGWGQIAIPLARRGDLEVTALEPTPERLAFIQAVAKQEHIEAAMHFLQATLFDIEFESGFDLACCVGVLEWVPEFRLGVPRDTFVDFLGRIRKLLKPEGRLLVGIENRLGLKYILGAPDDHTGVAGVNLLDAELASRKWRQMTGKELRCFTFNRVELTELLTTGGFAVEAFFAAFPDYKMPKVILPLGDEVNDYFCKGGFLHEHDGSRGGLLGFQDELKSHYISLARMGIAHEFVPSFYVLASAG